MKCSSPLLEYFGGDICGGFALIFAQEREEALSDDVCFLRSGFTRKSGSDLAFRTLNKEGAVTFGSLPPGF
jgi:hypothetical protein